MAEKEAKLNPEEKELLNEELEKAVGKSNGYLSNIFRKFCVDQSELVSRKLIFSYPYLNLCQF